MIEEIRIGSLGVIEESVLELGPGLTVITGETGAGKTMLVTALGLLLGGRADSGAVRTGARNARVEGVVRAEPSLAAPPPVEAESGHSMVDWPAHSQTSPTRMPETIAVSAPSATVSMAQKVREDKAKGIQLFDFTVGEPHCGTPEVVKAGVRFTRRAHHDAPFRKAEQVARRETHDHRPARSCGPGQLEVEQLAALGANG